VEKIISQGPEEVQKFWENFVQKVKMEGGNVEEVTNELPNFAGFEGIPNKEIHVTKEDPEGRFQDIKSFLQFNENETSKDIDFTNEEELNESLRQFYSQVKKPEETDNKAKEDLHNIWLYGQQEIPPDLKKHLFEPEGGPRI